MKRLKDSPSVIVVEDDPTLASFWLRLFGEMEIHDMKIVSDPISAMRLLDKGTFTMMISDVVLPHVNGYELAKYACRKQPDIKVVLTTGYSTDLSRFNLTGCRFHLIHKPYNNISEIKKLIQHLIKGENVFEDASEDSFSENEDYPQITEWKI